jgi:hypothetical protein
MNTVNCLGLIRIGLVIRWLMNICENDSVRSVLEEISKLETRLLNFDFPVSKTAICEITTFKSVRHEIEQLKETSIGQDLANRIRKAARNIEEIIIAEAVTKRIYLIPQRRYNGDFLIDSPDKLLKDGVFGKLSDIGKFDFTSASRCVAFGEATASAFHILRVTEDTLKLLYYKFKKTNRIEKPMWGPMTTELRSKRAPKPKEEILNALDIVRVSYRNPTQHPVVKYDIDSAQDLFGLCIDLINKMADYLDS